MIYKENNIDSSFVFTNSDIKEALSRMNNLTLIFKSKEVHKPTKLKVKKSELNSVLSFPNNKKYATDLLITFEDDNPYYSRWGGIISLIISNKPIVNPNKIECFKAYNIPILNFVVSDNFYHDYGNNNVNSEDNKSIAKLDVLLEHLSEGVIVRLICDPISTNEHKKLMSLICEEHNREIKNQRLLTELNIRKACDEKRKLEEYEIKIKSLELKIKKHENDLSHLININLRQNEKINKHNEIIDKILMDRSKTITEKTMGIQEIIMSILIALSLIYFYFEYELLIKYYFNRFF